MLRSITANGRDVTDVPLDMTGGGPRTLEVTLTESSSVITGTVRDAAGAVVGDTGVVVFPTDADRWRDVGLHPRRIRTATSASDGRYRIGNLPAGEYYVAAIDPADLRSWQDPAFLETMAGRAVRVTVDWDDTSPQDLRWTPR
jgi:hypothetical protein